MIQWESGRNERSSERRRQASGGGRRRGEAKAGFVAVVRRGSVVPSPRDEE